MKAQARTMSFRGPMVAGLACVLAVPLALTSAAAAGHAADAAPTHRVLLATSDNLDSLASEVTSSGGTVVESYGIAKALLADLPENAMTPQGAYVVPNTTMTFNALPTATATGSDSENTFKQTIGAPSDGGRGVSVAVIDTGVDRDANITVSGRANTSGGPAGDGYGHGTFMAGLVAGDDQQFGGVAPQASVYDVQVAALDGSTDMSRVLAGLQAVADRQSTDSSLRVAVLALNTQSPLPPHLDPLTRALDGLWNRGMTVVVASGNDGKNALSSPATDPKLLVAGAQNEADTANRSDDAVAEFSAYGNSFGVERPDLVAPGVSLISTSPLNSEAYLQNPNSRVRDGYLKGSGTSMSSAVTAGAVASLLAARPSLSPDQAKRVLMGSTYSVAGDGAGQGALDLGKAMSAPVSGTPSTQPGSWSSEYGPLESDADAWAAFSQAWDAGDVNGVAKAWTQMSEQTRKWAANAWSVAAVSRAIQADDATFDARRWGGARWVSQNWEARRWGTDEWVARRWGNSEWVAQTWDARRWGTDGWDARRWGSDDWLSFAWALRMDNSDATMQELWKAEVWDARRWGSDDWQARRWGSSNWDARRWGNADWVARRWGSDAWDARRWGSGSWDARRWGSGSWDARRWGSFTFEARRWGNETWGGSRWDALGW